MEWMTLLFIVSWIVSVSFDVHSFWRYYLVLYYCKQRRKKTPKKLLGENEFKVICLTTDLDSRGNMTSGRLLRECSMGQLEFRIENFLFDALERTGGALENDECHVTYTRPIRLFETFKIKSKLIFWEDTNLYLEQTVVLNKDRTECAVVLTRQRIVHTTVNALIEQLQEKVECPELTESLRDKIACVQRSL